LRIRLAALRQQHVDDLPRRAVAEQLPSRLLVMGNVVAVDQRNEVALGIATQRGGAEARIVRQKIRRTRMQVGKITASAAGNPDLLSRLSCLLKQQHRAPALAGDAGAHQARSACSEHNDVVTIQGRLAVARVLI
jgi:hypothetical protein